MNVLLVDDDYFVVTALEKKIDWPSLGVEKVHTAHNVAQAREIIRTYPVQILISDIEMPQGSGLELLAWIREEKYAVQAIFLTNYADFNYAQKAIELQSFEYFLKPIEFDKLMLIIQKAVARAREQQKQENAIREGYFWQKNRAKIREHFWRGLIGASASGSVKPADIADSVEGQGLSYRMDDLCQPVLIHLFPYDGSMGRIEKSLFDFALLNIWYELFQVPSFSVETVLEYKADNWIAVLKWNEAPEPEKLEALCRSFIQKANPYLKCDACCTIGLSGKLADIGLAMKELLDMNEEMTKSRNRVFHAEHYRRQGPADYRPPDLGKLEGLLGLNDSAAFLRETGRYLKEALGRDAVNASVLSLFRLDMTQLVYSYLKAKGIQAHKLYAGRTNDKLMMKSLQSVEDMEEYLAYLVNTAMEYRDFAGQPRSVVEEIKQYIHTHSGGDLSRNRLAEIVYLHPDYLARLFKKETGVSLGHYVIRARIAAAKHLLETTNLSVYAVAGKVGYSNYSYFLKLFKQDVGISPNDYKKGTKP